MTRERRERLLDRADAVLTGLCVLVGTPAIGLGVSYLLMRP